MRKTVWKITVLTIVLMMSGPASYSAPLKSWINFTNNTSKAEVEGTKVLSSSSFTRNFGLSLNRTVTPVVSYGFNLRGALTDTESANYISDLTTVNYSRKLEPTMEMSISNNIYNLNTGYRRQEQWSTGHYSNVSRRTSELLYSRLSVMPSNLPSFSLDLEKLKNFDHLPEKEYYTTTNSYSVASSYALPSREMRLGYNIVYSRDVKRTPLNSMVKSVNAAFTNNYNIGYMDELWNRKMQYSVAYRGNYSRSRTRQYHASLNSDIIERANNGGQSAQNNDQQVALLSNSELTGGDLVTTAGIDLSSSVDNHIGIQMLFGNSVERLYIYVDENISTELLLTKAINWQVYKSSSNTYGNWTPVSINNVNVVHDTLNNKYRYEILFSSSEEAFYFKAVNLATSNVASVEVTEIQAYGTDQITAIGTVTDVSTAFSQGINLNTVIRPLKKWDINFSYSIDRSDQNPTAVTDSISGIIENIFSTSFDIENTNMISTISRNYGASANWQVLDILTSSMRIGRNEGFNNTGGTESSSNNYGISMNYIPLHTVSINFNVIRNDSFTDNEKVSTNDAILFSADTKLHRDLNMVTDLGYSTTTSLANDTTSSLRSINGSLDARITKNMSSGLNYDYSTTVNSSDKTEIKGVSSSLHYQAGRFISFAGLIDYSNSAGNENISESFGINWLPLPKITMNVDYQHSSTDGELNKTTTDSVSSYATMYIGKFANLRVSYAYSLTDIEGAADVESHSIRSNVNCRF